MNCQSSQQSDLHQLINDGNFDQARAEIHQQLETPDKLTPEQVLDLEFQLDRMNRIEKDFTATRPEVKKYIAQYIPEVSDADIQKWEEEKSLESRMINGEKRYFKYAARNLFRINPEAKKIWAEAHKDDTSGDSFDLAGHDQEIIDLAVHHHQEYNSPVRMHVTYSISVHPDVVPAGEVIRCWIPFPREVRNRQTDVQYLNSEPAQHMIAPNDLALQRTIYLEKLATEGKPTTFSVEYTFTGKGTYTAIDPDQVQSVDPEGALKPYLSENPPHIVFTDSLKALSKRIIGDETNPYRVAQKLYAWVDNIPWASAREYSTISDISSYCYTNKHGDCGIQTLLLMTLCRMNGIPTRWQSGWEFKPPDDSMHDWAQIYFKPYGWVPLDVTYGQFDTDENQLRWFYLSGMDSYRIIFNDAFSQPFYPVKIYPRSETVDSQRGEVEWRGGNLYFDQWDWNIQWNAEPTM